MAPLCAERYFVSAVHVVAAIFMNFHFFFFGETIFFDFGEDEAELETELEDFAVLGFGTRGFFVGPALFDFLALDGDLDLVAEADASALVVWAFLSAADFLDFAIAAAAVFFSAAAAAAAAAVVIFFVFGEVLFVVFVAVEIFSAVVVARTRLFGDFLALAAAVAARVAAAVVVVLFFSDIEDFADDADEAVEANLKEPEAPLPFVCTSTPDATDPFKYFLINGATFSASTL